MAKVRARYALAIGASVAAHAVLALSIGVSGGSGRGHDSAANRSMTVLLRVPGDVPASNRIPVSHPDTVLASATETIPSAADGMRDAANEPGLLAMHTPTEPHYFSARELTEKPFVLEDIPSNLVLPLPDVPPQSTVVRLMIDESGNIDRVVMEDSRLPEGAAKLIAEAFEKTRFHPGRINGMPVKSQLRIEITLENAGSAG